MNTRESNRQKYPAFARVVDRYRGSIIAAWMYDPVTGAMLAGTAPTPEDHAPWPAEHLAPTELPVAVEQPYRGRGR